MAIQEITGGVGVLWGAIKTKLNEMFVELYAKLDADLIAITTGTLTATGFITGKKVGVFAYLSAEANTTITTAGTYEAIAGTFTNTVIESFSAATVVTPGIKYDGSLTQHLETDWHATIAADSNSVTVTMAVFKNGAMNPGSAMEILCKTAGESYSLSGTCVCEMETDDEMQLVVTSDNDGDVITVKEYTTTINEFFD